MYPSTPYREGSVWRPDCFNFSNGSVVRNGSAVRPVAALPAKQKVRELDMGQTVVLLAEDEATIRSLVTISLQHEDFSVLPASDADEALQVARNHGKIDLLLTDVQ